MKWYRAGIMRKQFDILPTLTIRWFIGYEGTRKFDIGCSLLCFYAQTTNFGRDRMKGWEMQQKELQKNNTNSGLSKFRYDCHGNPIIDNML